MKKSFVELTSNQILEKFPDATQVNSFFEIAQAMIDSGVEEKEIKKTLKELYGATKEDLERLTEKFFKRKQGEVEKTAGKESDEVIREELATVRNEMNRLIGRLEFLEGNIPITQSDLESKIYDIVKEFDNTLQLLNTLVESLTESKES
jgi:hypothetical protein